MNIGSKLILTFLLVTLLPTVLIAFLTTTIINSSMKDNAQEAINNNLRAAWMQYYARANQMQYGMLQASTEAYIKQAIKARDKSYLRRQLKAWKKYRPNVDLWSFVDADGNVIAAYNTDRSGWRLRLNGLTGKAMREGKSLISTEILPADELGAVGLAESSKIKFAVDPDREDAAAPETDKAVSDGMVLAVATPVMDESNRVVGAIICGDLLNNDSFLPNTFAENIPGSLVSISLRNVQISTNVMDGKGTLAVGSPVPSNVVEALGRDGRFRGETYVAGKRYITAFDPIMNHKGDIIGSIFVGVPMEKYVDLQYDNIKVVFFIALIGLILATGVASFITYLITRPIKTLTKKAHLIATGDLNVRTGAPAQANDEISDLARAFDIMVKNLREHEDKISAQKNLIESLINSLPYCLYVLERNLGIAVWNRHGDKSCIICNRHPGDDCYNLNFIAHLQHYELKEGVEKHITSVFESGEPVRLEQKIAIKEPQPREIFLMTSIFPIFSEKRDTVNYVVWMAEDITLKKEIDASVITGEKLAAIGQLAAGMAHEVNNPLGGILNCLDNIKNKRLTEKRKGEYLEFMGEGIKRVQNIVRQLLDFSQQHAPELRMTNINSVIEGLIPLFKHSIKGRDVRLINNLGHGLPGILVDKHQIEQVVVNLILNALQAVDGEGVIEVATRRESGRFCISVSDNGCGIAPDKLPKIFDPFFTTKGVGKGTGLGLSVSRGIIERHGGRIECESKPGNGTVFKVYLPMASA